MKAGNDQTTDTLLMIRPASFGFNAETAASNVFQNQPQQNANEIQQEALREFDSLVRILREHKLYVIVLQDSETHKTPDSIFPNNWISFHEGKMILYPMLAENRRMERRQDWITLLQQSFATTDLKDFSSSELKGKFLEGTGSLVLDRKNKIAYSNVSSRSHPELVEQWSNEMKYQLVSFHAQTRDGKEIYHTNVLMAIGETVAVICSEVISHDNEQKSVFNKLSSSHTVIEISEEQMIHFAGNMLLVKNREEKKYWVMSRQAFDYLTSSQKEILSRDGDFLYSDLTTIETIGGGSARCMMAEVF